jgi:hypothetical protein
MILLWFIWLARVTLAHCIYLHCIRVTLLLVTKGESVAFLFGLTLPPALI